MIGRPAVRGRVLDRTSATVIAGRVEDYSPGIRAAETLRAIAVPRPQRRLIAILEAPLTTKAAKAKEPGLFSWSGVPGLAGRPSPSLQGGHLFRSCTALSEATCAVNSMGGSSTISPVNDRVGQK